MPPPDLQAGRAPFGVEPPAQALPAPRELRRRPGAVRPEGPPPGAEPGVARPARPARRVAYEHGAVGDVGPLQPGEHPEVARAHALLADDAGRGRDLRQQRPDLGRCALVVEHVDGAPRRGHGPAGAPAPYDDDAGDAARCVARLRPRYDEARPAAAPRAEELELDPLAVAAEGQPPLPEEPVDRPVVARRRPVQLPRVELGDGDYVRGYAPGAAAGEAARGPHDEAEAGAAAAPEDPGDAHGGAGAEAEPAGDGARVPAPVPAEPVRPRRGDAEGCAEAGHGH